MELIGERARVRIKCGQFPNKQEIRGAVTPDDIFAHSPALIPSQGMWRM